MGKHTSVSAVAVVDLHDLLLELNVVSAQQLRAAGIYREQLIDQRANAAPLQEQRASETLLLVLWQLADRHGVQPQLGLMIGQHYNPSAHGVLASWLQHCSTAGEALANFQRNIALMNPSELWTLTEGKNTITLTVAFAPDRAYPQIAVERSLSALLRWTEAMTGSSVAPINCALMRPQPKQIEPFAQVFGHHLRFNAGRNSLQLPRSFLDSPIAGASGYLRQMLQVRALETLQRVEQGNSLSRTVSQLIRQSLPNNLSLDHICAQLHLSRQTLYRHLKQEGTSYTELVNQVRQELAQILIDQGLTKERVSEQLGFKDASTFYRAWRRWSRTELTARTAKINPHDRAD
ncbi:AraC family transcriptional regulator [Halopseudomonas sp.]|uniref:AraC family transcriptional regulator n=1 Tax=Halopseudomonas sp. TaxID=2901191 RepID=UPI0030033044